MLILLSFLLLAALGWLLRFAVVFVAVVVVVVILGGS